MAIEYGAKTVGRNVSSQLSLKRIKSGGGSNEGFRHVYGEKSSLDSLGTLWEYFMSCILLRHKEPSMMSRHMLPYLIGAAA